METGGTSREGTFPREKDNGRRVGCTGRNRCVGGGRLRPVMGAAGGGADAAAAPACGPRGQQNIAVLLVTFPGIAPPAGVTPASVHSMLFGTSGRSLHGYWNEASYGNVSATGTVLGWYTLNQTYSCNDYYAMRSAAIAAADPDIDFRNYNRLFIIFPNPGSCG